MTDLSKLTDDEIIDEFNNRGFDECQVRSFEAADYFEEISILPDDSDVSEYIQRTQGNIMRSMINAYAAKDRDKFHELFSEFTHAMTGRIISLEGSL